MSRLKRIPAVAAAAAASTLPVRQKSRKGKILRNVP